MSCRHILAEAGIKEKEVDWIMRNAQKNYTKYGELLRGELDLSAADIEGSRTEWVCQQLHQEVIHRAEEEARSHELQVLAIDRTDNLLLKFTPASGKTNEGLQHVLNVLLPGKIKAITNEVMSVLAPGLEHYYAALGMRKPTHAEELELARFMAADKAVNALRGKKAEDLSPIELLARQYREASDLARKLANQAGADIRYFGGRTPQIWDPRSIRFFELSSAEKARFFKPGLPREQRGALAKKARKAWVAFVLPRVDRKQFVSPDSGAMLDAEAVKNVLNEVWYTLSTGGLAGDAPEIVQPGAKSSLAQRLGAHRDLHFSTAEGFLEANRAFGRGNLFDAMLGDLRRQSRAIALMDQFGPNVEVGFHTVNTFAKVRQANTIHEGKSGSTMNELMWHELTGKTGSAPEEHYDLANRVMQGVRTYLTGVQLQRLLLSQFSDLGTFHAIAQSDGLDSGKGFRLALATLNPKNAEDIKLARIHHIATQAVINDVGLRFGAEDVPGLSRRFADRVIALTGAKAWTDSNKLGFNLMVGFHTADYRGQGFAELAPDFRAMLERYDIRKEDWDVLRQAESVRLLGTDVVTPLLVRRVAHEKAREVAIKFGAMLAEEADTGIATPGVKERAIMHQSLRPGTLWGEFSRSVMLYKSFSITMATKVIPRIFAAAPAGGMNRASIVAQWALAMIIMGGLSTQLHEITKGRDPRDMFDVKFWAAAALQSGGLGIFGDFLFSDQNRHGRGLAETIVGPVGALAADTLKLTVGNIQQAVQGKETHFGSEALQYGRHLLPYMDLWYTFKAFDHLIYYQIQEAVNHGYLRRMENRLRDEKRSSWWGPHDTLPSGPPDLGKALGK